MKSTISPSSFCVSERRKLRLSDCPSDVKRLYESRSDYEAHIAEFRKELSSAQELLYASDRDAVLIIFQGMDTAGKDGIIKHVFSGLNPMGCQVHSFKAPSSEELDHDFMWRSSLRLPERGRIGIFNRSYYEEVLVVRVHPDLLNHQKLPARVKVKGKGLWGERYSDIRNFEDYLFRNGTAVIKFFLHLSKDEQRRRLLARIDDPQKNWKMGPADIQERAFWRSYMQAYEDCLNETSTKDSPWYVIPADDKKNARLIVSQILIWHLSKLDLVYPRAARAQRTVLRGMRKELLRG